MGRVLSPSEALSLTPLTSQRNIIITVDIHGRIYVVPRPLRFCASTFGVVCGNRYEKLCRFSFIFSLPP
ncbi:hypothetical protein DVH24_019992 [Malus domestica]|uniref:Uncharacterized protein n=1 Tax=Malus domestica TaxID=3750 RepID=A0A498I4I5_MALDO|nr:hypothetical protein DVH24_019992 [Malus domestica]